MVSSPLLVSSILTEHLIVFSLYQTKLNLITEIGEWAFFLAQCLSTYIIKAIFYTPAFRHNAIGGPLSTLNFYVVIENCEINSK